MKDIESKEKKPDAESGKGEPKYSKKAESIISSKLHKLKADAKKSGKKRRPHAQELAIALETARREGAKVPPNPNKA